TNEPVVIVNSNLRGAGALVRSLGNSADITIRHTNGYGITPSPWKDYMKPRRFLAVDVFRNIVVENCYMEGTAGIYVGQRYEGNGTTANTIKIRYNKAKNIDGRVYGGGKALVQFVQFNFKVGAPHVEVAWNEVINEAGNSAVEDNINIYNSRGTASSPIRIHNNYIQGAYPIPHNNTRYTGGGIITDGDGDINTCPAYITASDNQLVNLGNYSMGIAGGNNVRYTNNRAVNSALHKDGSKFAFYTSGLWSKDYYNKNTTFSNSVDNNTVGITAWGYVNNRNDVSVAQNASFTNNTFLAGGAIATNVEGDELSRWTQKLSANGIVLGPKGGASAVANQAPTVSLTAPLANASIALGAAISIAANASDADGTVTKVEFFQGSTKLGESTKAPFSFNWTGAVEGSFNLTAKATDDKGATQTSAPVSIKVGAAITSLVPQLPGSGSTTSGTGKITREFWANVPGNTVGNIPVTTNPTSVSELTTFEAATNAGDNYGQRVRG
ncbi:Ig-like domain-containing protein, partial [Pontibacter sp. HJ8]